MLHNLFRIVYIMRIMFRCGPIRVADLMDSISPEFVTEFLNGVFSRDEMGLMLGANWVAGGTNDGAITEFTKTLRRLVDQWIDSGKNEQDASVDAPLERSIEWVSPQYQEPLVITLLEYVNRNRPEAWIGPGGRLNLSLRSMHPSNRKQTDPFLVAHEIAIYEFLRLLQTPSPERLSRCDVCGRYFVRTRAPKKDTVIKRGVFCSACQGYGAARRTVTSRQRRHNQLVALAAEYWPRWKQSRHGERSKWIAGKLREKLPLRAITGKWVSQHQDEIEAEVGQRRK
jgi:hypothetical protein